MKQIIQRLFTCLILGVVFCTTAWAADVEWDVTSWGIYSYSGTNNVTLKNRTFAANQWTSICLPFTASKSVLDETFGEGCYNIQEYNSCEGNVISFKKVTEIKASTPYFIRVTTTKENPIFNDVTFSSTNSGWKDVTINDNITFRGYFYSIYAYNLVNGSNVPNAYVIKSDGSLGSYKTWGEISYVGDNQRYGTEAFLYTPTTLSEKPSLQFEGVIGEEGGGSTGMTLEQKIKANAQLTDVPTIYLTVPDALNADGTRKDINSVIFKDRQKNEALYHQATIKVVDEKNGVDYGFTDQVLIKARGNSTADLDNGKLPYRLKFAKEITDEAGNVIANCQKHDMLGNGYSARNWTLLANQKDESMMRNALTYHIGQAVGMPFCPGYKFVDVVINGEYRGTYQISDHVEVGENRVKVNEDTGWFIESAPSHMCEEPKVYAGGLFMTIKNPEPKEAEELKALKTEVEDYFKKINYYMGVWSTPCSDEEFRDPVNGWRKYFDEESLVKFYIGINLTGDYDGFMTVKMYREANGKMKFGPLWDKDLAYGNWGADDGVKLCEEQQVNSNLFSDYMQRIMTDPVFVKKVHDKLHSVLGDNNQLRTSLHNEIDNIKKEISKTYDLNKTEKWIMGQNLNTSSQTLKDYITLRVEKLAERIDKKYSDLGGDAIVIPEIPDTPDDPDSDDTPVGDLGALVDLGNGKYSYTGSASTFKEGTVITITTSEGTSLSNYITDGNTWNTNKTITLSATDVTKLAANGYTFYMNATNGEVKAVNVKVPEPSVVTGLTEVGVGPWGDGLLYAYVGDKNSMAAGATFSLKLDGKNPYFRAYISDPNSYIWNQWGAGQGPKNYSYTVTPEQANALANNNYRIYIYVHEGTCTSASFVGASSGGSTDNPTTPTTHTLTLSASEGGTVSGAGTYAEGTTVLIKAIPNDGYKFVKWSDGNTYASRSVTLNGPLTLTATFAAEGSADEDPFNEQGTRKQLTDLPTIYLNADNINGEWLQAAVEVFDKDNKLYQGATWKKEGVSKKGNINVSVQYQGSGADNSKNSYRLKFNDKINLLSATGLYKQWVLLANDDDPTMLNNALAKELGDAVGMPWTPGYQFVDLYVNDKYMGTYQLTDRVKAEEGRSLVSGGDKNNDWQLRFNDDAELEEDGTQDHIKATNGVNVIYKNPDPKDLTDDQVTALRTDMTTYFNTVFTKNTDGTYPNFAANVDKDQLINWYICQEILGVYKGFSSIEAYRSVTEGAADNLLHFGPLWDSEKAFGNRGEADAIDMSDKDDDTYLGLMTNYAAYDEMKSLFNYLWTQPWFGSGVRDKWNALKTAGLLATLKSKADAISCTLSESQPKNAEKWTESLGGSTYETAIANIKSYLTTRFDYLDTKFNARAAGLCEHEFAYADNEDGTHKHYCTKCDYTDIESDAHTLTMVSSKAKCSVCELNVTEEVTGEEGEKVYILDAGTSKVQYITKTSGFTPAANNVYKINEQPEEETVFENVYWLGADGKTNYADKIVVDDSAPWNVDIQIMAKEATHTRPTASASIWGTVCLPFKTKTNDDVTLFKLSSVSVDEDGKGTMVFSEASSRGALTPLVFKKNISSATSVTFTSEAQTDNADPAKNGFVTVKPTEKMSKNKSASKDPLPPGWQYYGNVQEKQTVTANADGNPALYFISSNKFYRATSTLKVSTFRAYFEYTAPAEEAKIATFVIADDEATEIATTLNEKNSLAIFTTTGGVNIVAPKNMTVNIYTAAGALAKSVTATANDSQFVAIPNGIYVINGAKFVIK